MNFAWLKTILGIAAVLTSVSIARADEDASIQVKSVVEVDGSQPEITLSDLIVARGVTEEVLSALKSVRLADTPKAGESRSFTSAGLEDVFSPYLRKIEAIDGHKISLRIPTRVTVVRKSFKLKNEDVAEQIKSQLKPYCADCTFEISGLSLPMVPAAIPSGASWSIKLKPEMPKGSFSLPLEVVNEDGSKRTYWISGTLAVRRKVPVAARAIAIGERLMAEDFTLQIKDITFSNDVAASEQELASSIAARGLPAGEVIWRSSLRRELAVKNGDAVRVVAGEDGWQVMVDGIAQGGGYIGDLVKVKIPRTQKMISGVLSAKGVVEVH